MITPADADTAYQQSRDLGDCARILRERFPNSTSEDRIEAIRFAQKRVIAKRRRGKRWWVPNPERELPERTT
jgi:hypothetical protein